MRGGPLSGLARPPPGPGFTVRSEFFVASSTQPTGCPVGLALFENMPSVTIYAACGPLRGTRRWSSHSSDGTVRGCHHSDCGHWRYERRAPEPPASISVQLRTRHRVCSRVSAYDPLSPLVTGASSAVVSPGGGPSRRRHGDTKHHAKAEATPRQSADPYASKSAQTHDARVVSHHCMTPVRAH